MSGNKTIELIRPWGVFSVGSVFTDMSRAQRDILVERGLARVIGTEKQTVFGKLKSRVKK